MLQCSISRSKPIRSLQDTITRLKRLRSSASFTGGPASHRLTKLEGFGANPGDLIAWSYVPDGLPAGSPLVVVLHGCTQTADAYDSSTGWSKLAERAGFALLFPEQQRANNPNLCFNWFSSADARRDRGEALSIKQMVETMKRRHSLDPHRVFVTGLSAGGAMAAAMLATYPETFAAGAVIAGLPFGVADSVPEAFDRMRGHGLPAPAELRRLVTSASSHDGPWPTLSVWHGSADHTVDPANASALVDQWRELHRAQPNPGSHEQSRDYDHRSWVDSAGLQVVEEYRVHGFGHATPLDTRRQDEVAGPHMLDAGISSTVHIARSWGLTDGVNLDAGGADGDVPAPHNNSPTPFAPPLHAGVAKTIEDALRSAGLMP